MKIKSVHSKAVSSVILAVSLAASHAGANPAGEKLYSSKQLKVVEKVTPDYPAYADKTGRDGHVLVEFTVTPDGFVAAPTVVEASASMFSRAALSALENWQFEPVFDNGVAVPIRTNVRFSFVPRTE